MKKIKETTVVKKIHLLFYLVFIMIFLFGCTGMFPTKSLLTDFNVDLSESYVYGETILLNVEPIPSDVTITSTVITELTFEDGMNVRYDKGVIYYDNIGTFSFKVICNGLISETINVTIVAIEISTYEEFKDKISSNMSGIYILNDDITLGDDFLSIGTEENPFLGSLFGDNHSISGLRLEDGVTGLFGYIGKEAIIDGLNFVDVTGAESNSGTVAGTNYGKISNISVNGQFANYNATNVGGIVGQNYGEISDCTVNIDMDIYGDNIGGLAGTSSLKISPKYGVSQMIFDGNINNGNIVGLNNVGGLFGYVSTSGANIVDNETLEFFVEISNSENFGNIDGIDNVGGLIGNGMGYVGDYSPSDVYFYFNVIDCNNYGYVIGEENVGGILGLDTENFGYISETTNDAIVNGYKYTGGIVGYSEYVTINHSRNNGNISGKTYTGGAAGFGKTFNFVANYGEILGNGSVYDSDSDLNFAMTGGIVGYSYGDIANCENHGLVTHDIEADFVGGIAGYLNGVVKKSSNYAIITSQGDHVGGVVGRTRIQIIFDDLSETYAYNENYNEGNIVGINNVGGIYGSFSGVLIAPGYTLSFVSGVAEDVVLIDDNENKGSVTGVEQVGGIAGLIVGYKFYSYGRTGYVHTQIIGSQNSGSITGTYYVGGVYGSGDTYFNQGNHLTNNGDVTGMFYVGGITGKTTDIKMSINNGSVSSIANIQDYTTGIYVGGIAGYATESIGNINNGAVFNDASGFYTAGIIGYLKSQSNIEDNENYGAVNSDGNYVGGIAGYISLNSSIIIDSNINEGEVSGMSFVGGIFGSLVLNNADVYYEIQMQNSVNNGIIFGRGVYVGGIGGNIDSVSTDAIIFNQLSNSANITGGNKVGGIFGAVIGNISVPTTTSCSNTGLIEASSGTSFGELYGILE